MDLHGYGSLGFEGCSVAGTWLQKDTTAYRQKRKKNKPEKEEIKKNLPDNRGFRQVNKLRSEYHKRRIEVV